jgi:hypothetical protein
MGKRNGTAQAIESFGEKGDGKTWRRGKEMMIDEKTRDKTRSWGGAVSKAPQVSNVRVPVVASGNGWRKFGECVAWELWLVGWLVAVRRLDQGSLVPGNGGGRYGVIINSLPPVLYEYSVWWAENRLIVAKSNSFKKKKEKIP